MLFNHKLDIQEKALNLAKEYPNAQGFVASQGWAHRFLKRQHLSFRAITHKSAENNNGT